MSELTDFLKSKLFFKNLAIAIVIIVVFFFGAVKLLSWYTRHGQFNVLPDLSKMSLDKAEATLNELHLNYIIIDSSYDENLPPRTVLNQNPYAGAKVKDGRNIYLYITTSVPPQVEVPDMVDKSFRQAKGMLESAGLKFGRANYITDQCVDCVLKQLYKGKPIAAGATLPKGSVIDLTVGKGLNGNLDSIP
jgi:beta-lactam-binding protein with PASTA domain